MVTEYQHSRLYYVKSGHGPKRLLLFHGFGQDHTAFLSLAEALAEEYTLYLFDLYFHGQSEWLNNEKPLEKSFWKEVVLTFLREQGIERFSIAGFSLGGKFALATAEAFPEKTEGLFLIAPDGIKTNGWYSLATYPVLLRKLFKSMVVHPNRFFAIGRVLRSLGLVDKGLLRFAEHQMDTEEKRSRVYYAWIVLRHLKFDMKELAGLINRFEIPVTLVVGKYDKVIRPEKMTRLTKHLRRYKLKIAEAGHQKVMQVEILAPVLRG